MIDLKDRINDEIKAAMRAKDKIRLNVLRYLKKLFIENDTSNKPIPEMDIIISYAKKMKDSIEHYPAGSEQSENLKEEVNILNEFLPKALSENDVVDIIESIINDLDSPNMGAVMKVLTPKIKGQFDGKKASQLVNERLKR